jgi:hypothetical protein
VTAQQIADVLDFPPPRRTLQYHLKYLVDHKRLVMDGERRWARYRAPRIVEGVGTASGRGEASGAGEAITLPLSAPAAETQEYVPPRRQHLLPARYQAPDRARRGGGRQAASRHADEILNHKDAIEFLVGTAGAGRHFSSG